MGTMEKIQDGRLPIIFIEADVLPEAFHKACLACWQQGIRVPTPKHQADTLLGFDAAILICVKHPLAEPRLHSKGITDDDLGLVNYNLEVSHGIHDHWVRQSGTSWGYTYHGRVAEQIEPLVSRIKDDFRTKGRFGRDFQLSTWIWTVDLPLESEDPPCLQRIGFRIIKDESQTDVWRLNWQTEWRSRDLFKAWLMNAWALTNLQKRWAKYLSRELDFQIEVGSYIDYSASLHLYGLYFQNSGLQAILQQMSSRPWTDFAWKTEQYLPSERLTECKRIIAAQMAYERETGQKKVSEDFLRSAGYNLETYPYPSEWGE